MQQGDLVKLNVLPMLAEILESIGKDVNNVQVGIWLEDLITTAARRAQVDLTYENLKPKLTQLSLDLNHFTNGMLEPAAIVVLLRDLIEEYGSMILTYHIPVQNISLVNYDTLNMNIANREAIEDGTVTQEI